MVAMLMLILLGSPRLRHTTTKIQIQIINSHSLEDMLGKLRVEKVWAPQKKFGPPKKLAIFSPIWIIKKN